MDNRSVYADALKKTVGEKDWGTGKDSWKMLQIQEGGMGIYQIGKEGKP